MAGKAEDMTVWPSGRDTNPLPVRFDRIVRSRPDAVAVDYDGAHWTYAELSVAAQAAAGRLEGAGVKRGDRVAVLLDRSPELITVLLGILMAGAAYVPLDPQDPEYRLAAIVADAQPVLCVAQEQLRAKLLEAGKPVLTAAELCERGSKPGESVAKSDAGGQDLAYVAYTSGSTGQPKGVCVPHEAIERLVVGADYLRAGPSDVFLHFAPVAFDASTLEIWAPLLNGARLVIAPPGRLGLAELADLVARQRVTVLWLTAGLFHRFAREMPILPDVRLLIAGGDVLAPESVDLALAALPNGTVVNGYGPTENTTFTCCHHVREPLNGSPVPIGLPVTGTRAYVLDQDLQPVGVGELGRLFAAGAGLAWGYLGQPGTTAARFVPDPFAATPGERMYDTGDLVRLFEDGTLGFVGRGDAQVKIRGFRVEPGEVEAALRSDPDIRDAVVIPQTTTDGERTLIAFYEGGARVSSSALRRRLGLRLPGHMIPSQFSYVDQLPLTRNGKLDRTTLHLPSTRERPDTAVPYREPADEVERWLTFLWKDVIGVEPVGADDDFFELGGHSLMAAQITAEIAKQYGVAIKARVFYLNSTIAELAVEIGRLRLEGERGTGAGGGAR